MINVKNSTIWKHGLRHGKLDLAVPSVLGSYRTKVAVQYTIDRRTIPPLADRFGGRPHVFLMTVDRPWVPTKEVEYEVLPADEFGVPVHIPPEVSTKIKHTFALPPAFWPWLKKVGDDSPQLKPYTDKLIEGNLTLWEFEEMFYKSTKPLRIYRDLVNKPFRSPEEQARTPEVEWESAWLTYRQFIFGGKFRFHNHACFLQIITPNTSSENLRLALDLD
eukprot:Filipodium_phascolosomae@DN2014_c0_g1_i1.p1